MRGKIYQKWNSKGVIFALFVCFLAQAQLSHAGPTKSYGCQGVEPPTAEELSQYPRTELYGACPAENTINKTILAAYQDSTAAVKYLIKRKLFHALKEEALGDQLINRFRIWNRQGYGLKKEWKARSHYGSVFSADHPAAIKRLNAFIRERNELYADSAKNEIKIQKEKENLEYKKELITASQRLAFLEDRIKMTDRALIGLDRNRSPLHPRDSWHQEQMANVQFEKGLLLSEVYSIKDSYPILQVPLPSRYHSDETVSLAWYLNDLSKTTAIKINGQRPAALIDHTIRKAMDEAVRQIDISIHGDKEQKIPGLLDLNYSEKNLKKLLLLDGLRKKTLEKLDNETDLKVACEIVSSMIPEPSGWTKSVLYLGGMGLACGLGWFVSGPVACLSYAAVTGAGVGIYETAHAIPQAAKTHEDYKWIDTFFISSIEGPALASSEQQRQTYQDLKAEIRWAWTAGILTAVDLPFIAPLLRSSIGFARHTLKTLRAMRQGNAALGESIRESFKIARTLTQHGKDPQIYENLIKLMGEGDVQKIKAFNRLMAGFSELSPADQRLVLDYLRERPSIDINELKQSFSAEAETIATMPPARPQLIIGDVKYLDDNAETALDGLWVRTIETKNAALPTAGKGTGRRQIGSGVNWRVYEHPSDHMKIYKELRDDALMSFEEADKIRQLVKEEGFGDIVPEIHHKLTTPSGRKVFAYIEDRATPLSEHIKTETMPDTSRIEEAIRHLQKNYGKDIEFRPHNIGVNLKTGKAVLFDLDEMGKFWQKAISVRTGQKLKLGGALQEASPLKRGDIITFVAEDGTGVTLGEVVTFADFPNLRNNGLYLKTEAAVSSGERVLIQFKDTNREPLNITRELAEALTRQPHVHIVRQP